ncbi:MAG: LptF/LptG family permease, partial [Gammaproteobacteria bacterium]
SDGYRFAGVPGRLDWTVTQFAHANLLIRPPQSSAAAANADLDRMPTAELVTRGDPQARAALDWRIAQPLTVLVLLLIAVPLAHTRPRRGRYARLVPAILIYIVYYNLLGVARIWSAEGRLPLWWVPALAAAGGLALIWWHYGRRGKPAGRRHAH